jgi:CRISPR type IV-associated protein Csf1
MFSKKLYEPGDNKCYYCGSLCSDKYVKNKYVKKTFTNRDIVKYPESGFVCGSCVETMSSDYSVVLFDGELREHSRVRLYCWVITENNKKAYTKKHISLLREIILNPPDPPFIIVLADGGKKQLLFRSEIAYDKNIFPVMLEEKIIIVNRNLLNERLELADKLSAPLGKIAIKNKLEIGHLIQIEKYYGHLDFYEKWKNIYSEPMSQLAVWLAKNKEDAQNEYSAIISRAIQTKTGGDGRSDKKNGLTGSEISKNRDNQLSIDFT